MRTLYCKKYSVGKHDKLFCRYAPNRRRAFRAEKIQLRLYEWLGAQVGLTICGLASGTTHRASKTLAKIALALNITGIKTRLGE
jgi:hypothetical protein